ncbi:DUF2493 domain-containing protein [Comamonas sp. 4034]|uniref:DUF2493 domain-containing protein n=1 Tax=Comamonas sp. 4034 TaxID=3156455 RepID=UPI003D24CD01
MECSSKQWRVGMTSFVLCVCGGRDYQDRERVFSTLDRVHSKRPVTLLVHGDASGADSLAAAWAIVQGVQIRAFPAAWNKHGRRAGPIRNSEMVACGIDGLVAFPGGNGTADMVRQAYAAGVAVMEVVT